MSDEDYVFGEVIESVSAQYGLCVEKAKQMFTDEQAIQSASATMFINATKEKSSVVSLQWALKQKIAKVSKEAIPSAIEVWKWHFKALATELGWRINGYLAYCVSQAMSPEDVEKHVLEYAYRLRCEKLSSQEEKDALYEDMFGKKE